MGSGEGMSTPHGATVRGHTVQGWDLWRGCRHPTGPLCMVTLSRDGICGGDADTPRGHCAWSHCPGMGSGEGMPTPHGATVHGHTVQGWDLWRGCRHPTGPLCMVTLSRDGVWGGDADTPRGHCAWSHCHVQGWGLGMSTPHGATILILPTQAFNSCTLPQSGATNTL
ncbi:hypothetical protein ACOMHN_021331 [Nucella lapillus]